MADNHIKTGINDHATPPEPLQFGILSEKEGKDTAQQGKSITERSRHRMDVWLDNEVVDAIDRMRAQPGHPKITRSGLVRKYIMRGLVKDSGGEIMEVVE